MQYRIEIWDIWNRRIASLEDVPLVEATRTLPGKADTIRGVLPDSLTQLGHGYRVKVIVDGQLFCEGVVDSVEPGWGDTRKLILDQYVPFHKVIAFEAKSEPRPGNSRIAMAFENRPVHEMVRAIVNAAPGAIHYTVAHQAYPDGAVREFAKFESRKSPENELGVGSIDTGQWVGSGRMDLSAAFAKDGDTIAGIVVDGAPWPDLRLMLIDCEETSLNSHAVSRHPETEFWTSGEYNASGYKYKADAAKAALQDLINTNGIDYIELNPHRDTEGNFDDRIDAFGRYIGLVYGGGQCLNAAMVELGHADVYLYQDGKFHVPEMALKDFYSYAAPAQDSVEETSASLVSYDIAAGALEALTALAYAAGGYIWSVGLDLAVTFRKATVADTVVHFDPVEMSVTLGSGDSGVVNAVFFEGNPVNAPLAKTYVRSASVNALGFRSRSLEYGALRVEADADQLVSGILDDTAYPVVTGEVSFHHGHPGIHAGDLMAFRGEPFRRLSPALDHEWNNAFPGTLIARAAEVRHRFSGRVVNTRVFLTSPLRSVNAPIEFMVRTQPPLATFFEFRLDNAVVGLDMGYHLD
ncbi:MAG: hypothetical protein AMXMBFR84_29340 [Candidatus Hydrogenedentota bacterium]